MVLKNVKFAEINRIVIESRMAVCYHKTWSDRVTRWKASLHLKRGEVVRMTTYEALSLLFLGGTFLVALLAYIDRNHKRK